MSIFTIREALLALMPRWAVDRVPQPGAPEGVGGPYHYGYGLVLDGLKDWIYQGVRARFVDHSVVGQSTGAPEDALPLIGLMQQIVRGFQETSIAYRTRCRTALDAWRHAGSSYGVMLELAGYVSPAQISMSVVSAVSVWEYITNGVFLSGPLATGRLDNAGSHQWNWDGTMLNGEWSTAWIIMYTTGVFAPEGTWGDGQLWNDGVADPGVTEGTWGSTATYDQVAAIRDIARRWRPLHIRIVNIIFCFETPATAYNYTAPPGDPTLPDGNWKIGTKYVTGVPMSSRVLNGSSVTLDAFIDGVS